MGKLLIFLKGRILTSAVKDLLVLFSGKFLGTSSSCDDSSS